MGRFHRHDSDDAHYHHHHHHDHDHRHGHDCHHGHDHVYPADPDDTGHGDHSGYEIGAECVAILEDISSENDHRAEHNRELLADHDVEAINLMNSPGPGKTALLEKALTAAQGKLRVGIIEGDIETTFDVNRLEGCGIQISLLNTSNEFGDECYSDAPMVSRVLEGPDLSTLGLVMTENVGNLVCPAEFEVGETRRAMVYPLTKGEDKSVRYPVMFRSVQVVVINKTDLAPHPDLDMEFLCADLERVNSGVKVIEVSAKIGEGIDERFRWVNPTLVD